MTIATALRALETPKPELVHIEPRLYLMCDGGGRPEGPEFQEAIQALYSVAYGVKFALKARGVVAGKMGNLEALWDLTPQPGLFTWTAMIGQPPEVDAAIVEKVRGDVVKRKGIAAAGRVRLETFDEGACVQILHLGPYSREQESIKALHQFASAQGYVLRGRHHEIYLNDPRRVAPEKIRTLLRQPVELER